MSDEPLTEADWVRASVERYEAPLIGYAVRITGNIESARDVVQDTFLRLCTANRAKVDGHQAAWLYTVCRNRALDVRKKEARMGALSNAQTEAYANGGAGPGEAAARNETRSIVIEALGTLPEDQQEAFRLKFQDQLSYREISQVMGKSLGTVSKLITAALNTVRRVLRETMGVIPSHSTGVQERPSSQEA